MNNKNKFFPPLHATFEILGSFGGTEETVKKFTADMEFDVNIVQNTDSQVALALPYYSHVAKAASAATLSEEELGDASGGGISISYTTEPPAHLIDAANRLALRIANERGITEGNILVAWDSSNTFTGE